MGLKSKVDEAAQLKSQVETLEQSAGELADQMKKLIDQNAQLEKQAAEALEAHQAELIRRSHNQTAEVKDATQQLQSQLREAQSNQDAVTKELQKKAEEQVVALEEQRSSLEKDREELKAELEKKDRKSKVAKKLVEGLRTSHAELNQTVTDAQSKVDDLELQNLELKKQLEEVHSAEAAAAEGQQQVEAEIVTQAETLEEEVAELKDQLVRAHEEVQHKASESLGEQDKIKVESDNLKVENSQLQSHLEEALAELDTMKQDSINVKAAMDIELPSMQDACAVVPDSVLHEHVEELSPIQDMAQENLHAELQQTAKDAQNKVDDLELENLGLKQQLAEAEMAKAEAAEETKKRLLKTEQQKSELKEQLQKAATEASKLQAQLELEHTQHTEAKQLVQSVQARNDKLNHEVKKCLRRAVSGVLDTLAANDEVVEDMEIDWVEPVDVTLADELKASEDMIVQEHKVEFEPLMAQVGMEFVAPTMVVHEHADFAPDCSQAEVK